MNRPKGRPNQRDQASSLPARRLEEAPALYPLIDEVHKLMARHTDQPSTEILFPRPHDLLGDRLALLEKRGD